MRVIVTGPRDWKGAYPYRTLRDAMEAIPVDAHVPEGEVMTLVEGEAQGFDTMAKAIAEDLGWVVDPFPVKSWYAGGSFNPEAGHRRNQDMVDSGGDISLAGLMWCIKPEHKNQKEHITHGTADCIGRLEDAGIPIVYVNPYEMEIPDVTD
jgi:hypothetical protein